MAAAQAKFTDRATARDVAKMPDEYKDLLVRLLTIQADCEIGARMSTVGGGSSAPRRPTTCSA